MKRSIGAPGVAKLAEPQIVVCGAGALGSHLVDNLTRQGFRKLRVIDRDRVDEHNVSTQLYGAGDVGAAKVEVLRNRVFRAVEFEIEAVNKDFTDRSARSLLKGAAIVVDTFDNSASRQLVQKQCRESALNCLHVGLYTDYCEAIWDERYRVPGDVAGDVCEYPLRTPGSICRSAGVGIADSLCPQRGKTRLFRDVDRFRHARDGTLTS